MRKFGFLIFLISFIGISTGLYAQKPLIDSEVYGKWNQDYMPGISNDGKYASCHLKRDSGDFLYIYDLRSDWKVVLSNVHSVFFSPDSKYAIYSTSNDKLSKIILGTSVVQSYSNIAKYAYLNQDGSSWLVYLLAEPENELILENLKTGLKRRYTNVSDFIVNGDNDFNISKVTSRLLLKIGSPNKNKLILDWADLVRDTLFKIWEGENLSRVTFNKNLNSIAFISTKVEGTDRISTLWYYQEGMLQAEIALNQETATLDNIDLNAINEIVLSEDGKKFFLQFKPTKESLSRFENLPKVKVWTYFDPSLNTLQEREANKFRSYTYVFNTYNRKLNRLEFNGDKLISKIGVGKNDFLLVQHTCSGDQLEYYWNDSAVMQLYLVSAFDGSRKLICDRITTDASGLSPQEKYVVYYDWNKKAYFSFEVATNKRHNITKYFQADWTQDLDGNMWFLRSPIGIAAWTKDEEYVFLYDQSDLIKCNLSGAAKPINFTRGYGKENNLSFRIVWTAYNSDGQLKSLSANGEILLKAVNYKTKDEGFFKLNLGESRSLRKVILTPCRYEGLIKARDAEAFLVTKENADSYPNIFFTIDLKSYTDLTKYYPEKSYNWIKSELLVWKQLDGAVTQGILYKPENFNPNKKYPVIFYYYERLSQNLREFLYPTAGGDYIDIPTYVSNGYIVVVADIHFSIGNPGMSAYNSIVACASYLSRKPWVDSKKMALDGHSYAGYMTEYIISHSHLFSAAISASGWSNFISSSLRIRRNGHCALDYYEVGKQRMGGNLWDHPGNYIQASPIFQAYRVKTPILLMNNRGDDDVDFYEGIQFFNALRRLGKKCWLLEYEGANHALDDSSQAIDFAIREQQFMDHYLKNAPLPNWMVYGMSHWEQGRNLGYSLETPSTKEPGSLLTSKQQKMIDFLQSQSSPSVIID